MGILLLQSVYNLMYKKIIWSFFIFESQVLASSGRRQRIIFSHSNQLSSTEFKFLINYVSLLSSRYSGLTSLISYLPNTKVSIHSYILKEGGWRKSVYSASQSITQLDQLASPFSQGASIKQVRSKITPRKRKYNYESFRQRNFKVSKIERKCKQKNKYSKYNIKTKNYKRGTDFFRGSMILINFAVHQI